MAFSTFGNAGALSTSQGQALPEVQTEGLGFLSLAGDAKLQLTAPWSPPPAPKASLLSIAPHKGLVAAASPDAVVVASTDAVRKAFEAPKPGDSEIRPFTPQLQIPLPIRICQLAFSADEAYLILSAEQGGGLAVYDVDGLQQGKTQSAFEIPTNGESLRVLVPNHRPEKAHVCAVVTNEGKLLMANLKERNFIFKGNSQILKEQVSCVAWANKGSQLVAGLGDGTICQLTPEGEVKDEIPRPPGLDSSYYVSLIVWMANNTFLVFHVSTSNGPQTKCHLIERQGQNFQYQEFNDPVDPYGAEKVPHHTAVRLKDFPPNIQELLIFSSSAVPDIGLLGRSKTPLAPNGPVDTFANIELADDSKRATLPMGESLDTPSAIGVSLDLSSKDKVYKPIPTDEQDMSPGPLPGYWVLNEQGILSVWWVVYSESIRGGTTYPGLAVESGNVESVSKSVPQVSQPTPSATSNASPFGGVSVSAAPAFGGPSALGAKSSPWGSTSANTNGAGGSTFGSTTFGNGSASKPVFGSSSFGANNAAPATPAFGQSAMLGSKSSVWGSGSTSTSTPAFGQSGFNNASNGSSSPFGSVANNNAFSSFASQGGFAALGSNANANKPNIFASATSGSSGAAMDTDTTSSFPPPSSKPEGVSGNPFGSQPFKLGSTFKPDTKVEDSDDKKPSGGEKSIFGAGFTSSIGDATKAASNPFASSQGLFGKPSSDTKAESTTPTTTPSTNKFFPSSQPSSVPFGLPSSGGLFGKAPPKVSVLEPPKSPKLAPNEAPLPPESTSKAAYPIEDSSGSSGSSTDNEDVKKTQSSAEDLPLPPDSPAKPKETPAPISKATVASDAPLPPDPVKNKAAYSTPLPPLPGESTKPKAVADAPLPPDPVTNKKAYTNKLPPLPGAFTGSKPPSDAPLPPDPIKETKVNDKKLSIFQQSSTVTSGFKFPTDLPPVSDSEEDSLEDEEGTAAGSEGSGVDVAKDLSPQSTGANRTPGFTPQGSFDGGLGGSFSTISRPEPERRSNDHTRSFSAPGMASQILAASKKQAPPRLNGSIIGRDVALENAIMEQQRKAKVKKEAEEAQFLIDEEDDAVQRILRVPIEPTLELDEFIAHSGVVPPAGDSIPAQVEAVYRDINSMMDTLGLNLRSLKAWTSGHKEFSSDDHSKEDLASPEAWTLEDIGQLTYIVDQVLGEALDQARVTDVEEKVAHIQDIQREHLRDCNKQADIRKIIASRLDPEQAAAYQALPLSAEQAAQQSDLRRQLGHFQSLLAQAEENLTMLKAKLVSANSTSGRGGPVPTIEAIVRTITKMTSMVEKRSGDIDVLENQMRKLRLSSIGPGRSREGSPLTTPNAKRTLGSSIFSPDRSTREATPMRGSLMRHSLSGSISGIGGDVFRTPPRKKLSGFGDAERKAVKEKREKRATILGKLRNSLEAKGPTIIGFDDIA
ncbi:hypothetical protein NPX13_g956 [Xylaria arbuscula]|uniref:Nucleoporin Nup159/Nup146 N-terminal domain-containing protein n=1 Tax=Xylaria arbuscula TaxID=114810 RepID=A0A9W8TRP4_9PEZI|nr:hypothetical protein NPX13_g956 [Xylaria arbuscula]